jgi:EAL domain-containing protein (putative c-di-GMP-specific phosphodiesterase class I)
MRSTMAELSKTSMKPTDIVFEVVESEHVKDPKNLKRICDYYRKESFGFALDDVGTGSNSFQMICDLTPDFIKLDKSLIGNVRQPMYYSAIGKLTEFASQYSLNVIAEGIEDADTMEKLQSLGVRFMQGYYFGKPSAEMANSSSDLIQLGSKLASLTRQPVNV